MALTVEPDRDVSVCVEKLLKTVFRAVCALRILLQVGIAFLARGNWSAQPATIWLEKMLELVSVEGVEGLTLEEKRKLISRVRRAETSILYLNTASAYRRIENLEMGVQRHPVVRDWARRRGKLCS
ncbi:hypothetical protein CRV24_005122 [Beauveria bassiana]|nr:hypothetical protein CRV24_005122 [Beauveria bassiana]KAH8711766.1 hypothetical protein HC256_008580 [Beauveria bassiana]